MDEKIERRRRKRLFRRAVAFAVLYVIVSGPLRWFLAPIPYINGNPEGAALVIGSLLLGPVAAVGGILGSIATDTVAGTVSITTLYRVPAVGLAAVSASTLWRTVGPGEVRKNESLGAHGRQFVRYALVAVVSLTLHAAMYAWSLELLSLYSFSVVAPTLVSSLLPLTIVAFPVWSFLARRIELDDPGAGGIRNGSAGDWGRYRKALLVVTPVVWFVVGTVVSYVFRATNLVPAERIGRRLVPLSTTVLDLAGPQGTRVQILGGVLALLILLWLLNDVNRRGTY